MANSSVELVNRNVSEYVDSIFKEYTTHVTCPKDAESYKEWFIGAFLPCCITRWYEPSCYDIHNMFTIEQFFDNSIHIFSDILQILSDYFDDYNRTMDMDKFTPENVMRCYTSIYVINNIDYFLDRYQDDDISNARSETSDTLSIDLFQSTESSNPDIQSDLIETTLEEGNENIINNPPPSPQNAVNIVGYDDTDEEGSNETSSIPGLFYVIDDTETLDGEDEEGDLFETGVFVTENEFIEKNKNVDCVICWEVAMNYENSMKWNNCDHFSCITCHDTCMFKKIYTCPLCRR